MSHCDVTSCSAVQWFTLGKSLCCEVLEVLNNSLLVLYSDLKAKARRWDEKQVDGLKRKRDSLLTELKDLSKHRRKEPELQNLRSQIDGLEHRLRYSTKDKETTVSQYCR